MNMLHLLTFGAHTAENDIMAKGKSLFFEIFLLIGYACGIARKVIQTVEGSSGFLFYLSFFFYVLNFIEISIDVMLYFRNKKLDEAAEAAQRA